MDPKVAYWTGALVNLVLAAGLAVYGVGRARRGDLARHARAMRAAAALVALFLVSYVVKLEVLGRENLALWSPRAKNVLHVHELCVVTMLIAGGTALFLSRRLRRTRLVTRRPEDPLPQPGLLRTHRLAGRTAVVGALLGAATAALVLAGMYARGGMLELPALAERGIHQEAP